MRAAAGLPTSRRGVRSRPHTRHAIKLGSIVEFTAAIVLQLVAKGRVSLDGPISRIFPDWPQPGAATVRQLLNHSSGLQNGR